MYIRDFYVGNKSKFILIAGPCQLESESHAFMIADELANICKELNISFVYKTSFDKANRTSLDSPRGMGLEEAIPIFEKIYKKYPICTDIHESYQADLIKHCVDIIQIPALLSRQTDLLIAAAKTDKFINIKKGQFMSPYDMEKAINKICNINNKILLTERGTFFGYNNLVVDFRSIEIMKKFNYPVIFDATHSVQLPGGNGNSSGGQREFVLPLSRAATSMGIAGLFIETHDDPDNAPSDGPNMIKLQNMYDLLIEIKELDEIARRNFK